MLQPPGLVALIVTAPLPVMLPTVLGEYPPRLKMYPLVLTPATVALAALALMVEVTALLAKPIGVRSSSSPG